MVKQLVQSVRLAAFVLSLVGVLALASGAAYGQATSGNLTGTVVDPSGAAVNGATVEAVNVATQQKVSTTTQVAGEYRW